MDKKRHLYITSTLVALQKVTYLQKHHQIITKVGTASMETDFKYQRLQPWENSAI